MIKYISLLFSISLVAVSFPGNAQDNFEKDFFKEYPREEFESGIRSLQSVNTGNYDAIYCRLEFTVDPAVYFIDGKATTYFVPIKDGFNSIYFDFSTQLQISKVNYGELSLEFQQIVGDELKVDFPDTLAVGVLDSITVQYSGQPTSSGFGSFAIGNQCGEMAIPSMWTLSEPYGAKHWWPSKQTLNDKYDSVDVIITTPSVYRAASNGVLISEKEVDGNKVYHWSHRYAIPAYLVAFAVSEYEVYSDWVPLENGEELEILNYIFPCNVNYAKNRTPGTIPIMQFYREKFGEYPYINEKYGHCNFGWGGGMEHATMSFMGGFSHLLIAHELAHQWFGDKITCGSWQDIWLNEGFATYLEGLTYDFGVDPSGWDNWKTKNQARATSDPMGSVWVNDTTYVNRIFNGSLSYSKGAYLLHMLRWMMGDDSFFTAINNYINDPELAYGYARTADLQEHLEQVSGLELDEFFKDWFYGGGFPNYEILWSQSGFDTWININQTPSNPLSVDFFDMPLPLYFSGEGKDTTIIFNPTTSGELFNLDLPFIVEYVLFDPEKWICARSQVLTSVIELSGKEMKVFPNPAKNYVKIKNDFSGDVLDIHIYDYFGRLVINQQKQKSVGKFFELNTTGLQTGVYLLEIIDNSKRSTTKLIIEN